MAEQTQHKTDILSHRRAKKYKAARKQGMKMASVLPKSQLYSLIGLKKELQRHGRVH